MARYASKGELTLNLEYLLDSLDPGYHTGNFAQLKLCRISKTRIGAVKLLLSQRLERG